MALQSDELASVSQEQWIEIWHKLRLHTWRRYYQLAKLGVELDDMVHQAIVDTLQGKRRWPPVDEEGRVRDVSLLYFLSGVVRSNISHLLEQEKGKISIDGNIDEFIDYVTDFGQDEDLVDKAIYSQLTEKMYELLADDKELTEIVSLWQKDPDSKPSDIAQHLGLDMKQMRNAQKRLRRKLKGLERGSSHV